MLLTMPVGSLKTVGKKLETTLERLGIKTAGDLLYYYPFRYEDYSRIVPIKDVQSGESVTIKGKIELIANKRSFKTKKMITEALVTDGSDSIRVAWFNQPFIAKNLTAGQSVYLSGEVKQTMLGPELMSPSYERDNGGAPRHTGRIVPMYPLTYGVTQKQLRFLVGEALKSVSQAQDWLPTDIASEYSLLPLSEALKQIHFPDNYETLRTGLARLKFNELFLLQMMGVLSRRRRETQSAPAFVFYEEKIKEFVQSLPFTLTPQQKQAAWEILKDTMKPVVMNRLLAGDVGSGKTVVAAMAMYNAALNNFQSALMVPTEILAMQHAESLAHKILPKNITLVLFTRTERKIYAAGVVTEVSKRTMLETIQAGQAQIIIGTQALLSENVEFKNLGLVIVDEQHRFGVNQRKILAEKMSGVHFLSMTATPIPRSLAIIAYGDLDYSALKELPPGRHPIVTRLVENNKRSQAYDFIRSEIKKGHQCFVVCPLIEEDESKKAPTSNIEQRSVMKEYEYLSKTVFSDCRVGFLHGKLKPVEKEKIMNDFREGKTDILVSTSVIEVGVDIPNATIMMIEGGDRFGLAQLHQFRGRVGRGENQSYCLVFTDNKSKSVLERLAFFAKTGSGFTLAEKDLELRGPGEVYGREQSGMNQLRLAILSDTDLIKKARLAAEKLSNEYKKYPLLKEQLQQWEDGLHLE